MGVKLTNSIMIPKELSRELNKLSLKDRRSSSSASAPAIPIFITQQQLQLQDNSNDVAVFDDFDPGSSPQILATSVESTNELLPTLSHISLLSLRDSYMADNNTIMNKTPSKKPSRPSSSTSSRPPSFSHSRVSSFHQHQRHPSTLYFQNRRSSTQQLPTSTATTPTSSSTTQPINIYSNEPDTPVFGPTSLSNSPSHFNLGNQQLPASLQSRHHFFPPTLLRSNSNLSQQTLQTSAPTVQIPQIMTGYMSPFLNPVPGDNVPMTPLMLSHSAVIEDENEHEKN